MLTGSAVVRRPSVGCYERGVQCASNPAQMEITAVGMVIAGDLFRFRDMEREI